MKNNIFNFATSELSQDAFLCWCLNWINIKDVPGCKLNQLAVDLLTAMGESEKSICHGITIKKQLKQIDLLVSVHNVNRVIIIEDKTYTSEHGDQIARYKNAIKKFSESDKIELGIDDSVEIRTVYFKTGFMYDYDREVNADIKIDGKKFLDILKPYSGDNYLLDSYIDYLENEVLGYYDKYGIFSVINNMKNHTIAQYRLMREIFPEKDFPRQEPRLYSVYDGSNRGGRPWTEMRIYCGTFPGGSDQYSVFWRIDSDNKGCYISLRYYDRYNKRDEKQRQEHIKVYEQLRNIVSEVIQDDSFLTLFESDNVLCGYRGNYYEAELFTWHIDNELKKWETKGSLVIEGIRSITRLFLSKL